ncbi:peptidase S10 [Novosphingobium sp. YJ-S2-02]|uniref:Peptidase S10 n=1 Tax=Novosphingobium aureum TaxID=2792964 RepID=A0A931HFL5_9SPHN|nr:peptidase S10 [Novosphingobium aureum]MBH0114528.1 peptidase S10 [Novosphingobium aureum]
MIPRQTRLALAPLLAALALGGCQHAGPSGKGDSIAQAPLPQCDEGAKGVRASLSTPQGPLAYRACGGWLEVEADDGTALARLFHTDYLAAARAGEKRPVAFVWNGGPGADSRLLQFHALGPRTLDGASLADNRESPLAAADLVFLDPAGTGFSRVSSEVAAKRLYATTGDIDATVRFIRDWLAAHGREGAPVYLVGESFGTWRASGVAEALIDAGQPVAGIALISGGIPMGEERDRSLMRALSLPNRTATALALGKADAALAADPEAALAASERFAREIWYPALRDPAALDDAARARVVAGLARFMGLAPAQIDAETLWVSPRAFRQALLADKGLTLGIFDMRRTGEEEDEALGSDAILAWYRDGLGIAGEAAGGEAYAGIDGAKLPVGSAWQYDQSPITKESLARAMAGEGPPSASQPWVARALEKDPAMRVFVAIGLYDSLNGCAANREAAADFPPAQARRIAMHCYRGGHMMYEDPAQAEQFAKDVSSFFRNSPDAANRE